MRKLVFDIDTGNLFVENGSPLTERERAYAEQRCAKELRYLLGWNAITRRVIGRRLRLMLPASVAPRFVRDSATILSLHSPNIAEVEFRRLGRERPASRPKRPASRPKRTANALNDFMRLMMRENAGAPWMAQAFRVPRIPSCLRRDPVAPPLINPPPTLADIPEQPAPVARRKHPLWRDAWHFVEHLKKRGFHMLGSGAFSMVLSKPGSTKVIKVARNMDAWPDYVMWAHRNGYAGTWAPRVYSFHRIEGQRRPFYVAVVERLSAVLYSAKDKRPRLAALAFDMRDFINGKDEAGVAVGAKDPRALVFALAFRLFAKSTRAGLDLHGGNWMVEGDRLVLTDPLTEGWSSTSTPPRMRSKALASLPAL